MTKIQTLILVALAAFASQTDNVNCRKLRSQQQQHERILLDDEYLSSKEKTTGYDMSLENIGEFLTKVMEIKDLPDKVPESKYRNLVQEGFQTYPYNQGQCGSCYAMAFHNVFSARAFQDTGKLYAISPQHYLGCKNALSCSGGDVETDLDMTIHSMQRGGYSDFQVGYQGQGSCSDAECLEGEQGAYGPQLTSNKCPGMQSESSAAISFATDDLSKSVGIMFNPTSKQMMQAIDKYGAVKIGMSWPSETMNQYPSLGPIVDESYSVKGDTGGHAVTVVGYNATGKYFIVRNSHGLTAQDHGYFLFTSEWPEVNGTEIAPFKFNSQVLAFRPNSTKLGPMSPESIPETPKYNPFPLGVEQGLKTVYKTPSMTFFDTCKAEVIQARNNLGDLHQDCVQLFTCITTQDLDTCAAKLGY